MKVPFIIIGLGLAALVGFQGYTLFNLELSDPSPMVLENNSPATTNTPKTKAVRPKKNWLVREKAIIDRNLFKVAVDRTSPPGQINTPVVPLDLEKTRLKLTLWGTVAGDQESDGWAVIEDLKKRKQSLYRVGDKVQGGKIKSISRNLVVLTVNGEDEILEATTPKSAGGKNDPLTQNKISNFFPNPADLQLKSSTNTPSAVFQAMKTRTYFKDGQPAGLMVYGTKPGANLQTLGLKKGDIIRSINETPIQKPEDLTTIAADLDATLDIQISLYRRGKPKELIYNGQEQTFTLESAEE